MADGEQADGNRTPLARMTVRVPKTAELVAGAIRRQITGGELKDGDVLAPEAPQTRLSIGPTKAHELS